jgi:hypothetical protein
VKFREGDESMAATECRGASPGEAAGASPAQHDHYMLFTVDDKQRINTPPALQRFRQSAIGRLKFA